MTKRPQEGAPRGHVLVRLVCSFFRKKRLEHGPLNPARKHHGPLQEARGLRVPKSGPDIGTRQVWMLGKEGRRPR